MNNQGMSGVLNENVLGNDRKQLFSHETQTRN